MRKFIFIIVGTIALSATVCLMLCNSRSGLLSLHPLSGMCGVFPDKDISTELRIDTIMHAHGHSFGHRGEEYMWHKWYFDSICVGDCEMLTYDSIGPSTLKLTLVTRNLIVDLGDSDALAKIRNFMKPVNGFRRFQKRYEKCLDSVEDEKYGIMKYMGEFVFTVDYPDGRNESREKINRFICEMADLSENEKAKVPSISAFYAGFNNTKYYSPVYTGNATDIQCLSDYLAHRTFENWIRGGTFELSSNKSALELKSHVENGRFITFTKYEYECVGTGHGMFTETFHTLDLQSGKRLRNSDIFKSNSIDKVKMRLFEVMAKDPHYLAWHKGLENPEQVGGLIAGWQNLSSNIYDTEGGESHSDVMFELPDGAFTESGIIFSFQPYEIDGWAAGAFHFIVPYKQVMSYLTPGAKSLLQDVFPH